MSVIIRKAVLRDTSVLAELSVQARVFHNGLSCGYFADPDPRAEKLFFKQAVAAEDKIILAAEKNGRVAGFLQASLKSLPYLRRPSVCLVETVCVDQACRRKGIGKALMTDLRRRCDQNGVHEIRLGVFTANTAGLAFYQSLGFTVQEQKMQLFL